MFRILRSRLSRRAATAIAALVLTALATGAAPPVDWEISGQILARSRNEHTLRVGQQRYVVVAGDGDTDLDCWLYGPNGRVVSSDTDNTDVCVLPSPGVGEHRLVIRNLGSVLNNYVVTRKR